jgi:hypothetical protein
VPRWAKQAQLARTLTEPFELRAGPSGIPDIPDWCANLSLICGETIQRGLDAEEEEADAEAKRKIRRLCRELAYSADPSIRWGVVGPPDHDGVLVMRFYWQMARLEELVFPGIRDFVASEAFARGVEVRIIERQENAVDSPGSWEGWWKGWPPDRATSGWHWLAHGDGEKMRGHWDADRQVWTINGEKRTPDVIDACSWLRYDRPASETVVVALQDYRT